MASKASGGSFILPGDLAEVFTVNDLTDEQKMIRDSVKEFVADKIITEEAIKAIEGKNWDFSRSLLSELGELGLLGAEIPEEYGGQGLDKVTGAVIAEEIAKQGSFACTFLADTGIGMLPIRYFGTEEQKNKYLPKLISGEMVAAYCLTESGAGSDAGGVKTRAVPTVDGKSFLLTGEKIFVTNGGFADVYVVFAQMESAVETVGLTAFIVERGTPGLTVGKEEYKIGIRGSSTATLVFDNVEVLRENILGDPGKGFKIALSILNLGRFKLGAASLGAARLALEDALRYSRVRKQFNKNIYEFGAIRQKLAHMAAKIYAMESIVYRTAGHLENAIGQVDTNDSQAVLKAIEEYVVECSLVKVFCSEALDLIVDENVQIHGGYGFCEEYSAARYYRDSRINRIFEGTNEINRMLAIGMLLKKATKGILPLMPVIKQVMAESMTPSLQTEPEDLIERLAVYLNNAKKIVLLAAGAVSQKFGMRLEEHQMILMLLSDCLINLYVMDSSLAALAKARTRSGEYQVRLIFSEFLFETEKLARKLIATCAEGDEERTMLAMVRRLLKFRTENEEALCERIVENL